MNRRDRDNVDTYYWDRVAIAPTGDLRYLRIQVADRLLQHTDAPPLKILHAVDEAIMEELYDGPPRGRERQCVESRLRHAALTILMQDGHPWRSTQVIV